MEAAAEKKAAWRPSKQQQEGTDRIIRDFGWRGRGYNALDFAKASDAYQRPLPMPQNEQGCSGPNFRIDLETLNSI